MNTIAIRLLADEKYEDVRSDVNRARHLINKSAAAMQCTPEEIISVVKNPHPIKLFELDGFPL